MRHIAIAAGLIFALASGSALAQNTVQGEDKTVFKKKTIIDFTDVTLEGELTKPEGAYGMVKGKTRFGSHIQLRSNFNAELEKSVDQL